VIHPPGASELVVNVTAAAVRDEVGAHASHVVSVMHDITASEHAARMRDEFFAAAAHALKTPMAIIKTNVQSIGGTDHVQLYQSIAAIERQCSRVDRLIQNLLVLARTRSSTLELRCTDVALAPLVERIVGEMTASPRRRVDSVVAATPRVRADEDRLALTLRDLIDLACTSAIPESTVTVKLRQHGDDAEIGVAYQTAQLEEEAADRSAPYDEARISELVVDCIVAAHGWKRARETADSTATTWLRMPVSR
jgi:signal transduction histidine kinase